MLVYRYMIDSGISLCISVGWWKMYSPGQ